MSQIQSDGRALRCHSSHTHRYTYSNFYWMSDSIIPGFSLQLFIYDSQNLGFFLQETVFLSLVINKRPVWKYQWELVHKGEKISLNIFMFFFFLFSKVYRNILILKMLSKETWSLRSRGLESRCNSPEAFLCVSWSRNWAQSWI